MLRYILFVFISAIVTSVFAQGTKVSTVNYKELLTIGAGMSGFEEEDYFGRIEGYAVDTEGNIYIADSMVQTIKVFNKEGKYIRSIGQRGRGPGEFMAISGVFISNKFIYALDPMQFRISKFSLNGRLEDTFLTSKSSQDLNFFRQVLPNSDDTFLVLYKQWGYGNYAQYDKDEIVHIWDKEFSEKLHSFGSFTRFGYKSKAAEVFARHNTGSMAFVDESNLVVAPYLYDGQIHLFEKINEEWVFKTTLNGLRSEIPYFVDLRSHNGDYDVVQSRTPEGEFFGKVNVTDAGLYATQNYLMHFLLQKQNKDAAREEHLQWELGVELFSISMDYLGYFPLRDFTAGELAWQGRKVDFMDNKGRFYMYAKHDGSDVVKVFEVDVSPN